VRHHFGKSKPSRADRLSDLDTRFAFRLERSGRRVTGTYDGAARFMRRFRLRGVKRLFAEVAGDVLTGATALGLLMLGLALPAFEATKTDWRGQLDYAVTFYDRYGNEIGQRGIRHDDAVPLERMPDHLIEAVLATEDRRFFEHLGIDVLGTTRALLANLEANEVVQGGSSITQQLAKNLFLSNERTLERKIKEAFLAVWLEANLSKEEILKLYLDRAYLGGGTFGVAAAAEFYFGKSVEALTLSESALLAGLFQAPARYAPHVNLPAARARANEVLSNMVEAGFVSQGQAIAARRQPAEVIRQAANGPSPDYFLDWAFEEVKRQVPEGDRVLFVTTTIDLALQESAEDSIEAALRQSGDRYGVEQGALVALEVGGAVRAMVGGRDYGESQFNRATDALRQPGSAFKPFVYATAMMNGYTPDSVVADAPITIGDWSPRNYTRGYSGPMTLTNALVRSINTIPVRLAQAIGRDRIVETAYAMGITSELLITRSLPLGTSEVTVLDMAGAFGTLATGGFREAPFAFTEIRNNQGEVVYGRPADAAGERVLEPLVVEEMNGMLVQVPEWGTGTRARLEGIPTAGKTGTTSAYRDAWFVGFTGNFVTAVWFGNDDFSAMNRMTGGLLPAETWQDFMTAAHEGVEARPIPYVEGERYQPAVRPAVAVANPVSDPGAGDVVSVSLSPALADQLRVLAASLAAPAGGEPPLATP
jgi:penicillin-binding protein 1A